MRVRRRRIGWDLLICVVQFVEVLVHERHVVDPEADVETEAVAEAETKAEREGESDSKVKA